MSAAAETAVVLLSGGVDSTTLLHHVRRGLGVPAVLALSAHYGQRHGRELEAARWQAARAGVLSHEIVDLSCLGSLSATASALTGAGQPVPDLSELPPEVLDQPPTYVPHRNLVLLSLAAAYAEAHCCGSVFYGAQAQDRYGYWDCTPVFVERLNAVLALNRRAAVTVRAPFAGRSKAEVLKIGLALGIDYSHTWTCYRGGPVPCGSCPSCVERDAAFGAAGAPDPLAPPGGAALT